MARSRPQGLCGRKCREWQLRCIAELPLTGVGIGRRSLIIIIIIKNKKIK